MLRRINIMSIRLNKIIETKTLLSTLFLLFVVSCHTVHSFSSPTGTTTTPTFSYPKNRVAFNNPLWIPRSTSYHDSVTYNPRRVRFAHLHTQYPMQQDYSDDDEEDDDDYEEEEEEDVPIRMTKTTERILTNNAQSVSSSSSSSSTIYSIPALYDLASSYRNYQEEVRFLLWAQKTFGQTLLKQPQHGYHILELAAGPARHSITALKDFSSQIQSCTAMDTSTDMFHYAQELVQEELFIHHDDTQSSSPFKYIVDDMRFMNTLKQNRDTTTTRSNNQEENQQSVSNHSFDAIWLISGSMSHLLTQDDTIQCFQSCNQLLHKGGLLILEVNHPKELFHLIECTKNTWNIPLQDSHGLDYGSIQVVWGDTRKDSMDPIQQVRNMTLSIEWKKEEGTITVNKRNKMTRTSHKSTQGFGTKMKKDSKEQKQVDEKKRTTSVHDIVPMRSFTMQEIHLLSKITGFHIVGTYGALDEELDIQHEDAFRMVCVLRKE